MKTTHLLLVDDSPIFLNMAVDFLQQFDDMVVVGTASDGVEGLKLAQNLQPQIILLDLDMPNLSGLDVIARLQTTMAHVGIIVLTFHDTAVHRQAVLAAGADDFVCKQQFTAELLPAIRRLAKSNGLQKGAK